MTLHHLVSVCALSLALSASGQATAQASPVRYVALGSSFASGPGLPTAIGEPDATACGRSKINYPHLLAQRRHLVLVDVSCGGATTANILQSGQFGAPAQQQALTPETALVTVTIGGNDVFYLRTLGGLACQKQPRSPNEKLAAYCTPASVESVATAFAELARHLQEVAAAVHERAPKARLVYVTYLSILPVQGTCDRLQLTSEEADRVRGMAERLNVVAATVARAEHADLLDTAALSRGHDACSAAPWTNGFTRPDSTGHFAAVPFHPNAAGMEAIATALDELLANLSPPLTSRLSPTGPTRASPSDATADLLTGRLQRLTLLVLEVPMAQM